MTHWLPSALCALLSFGLWGLFSKLSITHIDTKSALVFQTVGVILVGVVAMYFVNFKPATDIKGVSFGLLTGIAYSIGCLFYLIAADKGKLITVVTLTALYPLITIVLSYIVLKEVISIKQSLGIGLAIMAIFLMAG